MGSLRRSHAAAAKLTNANGFSKNAYDDVFAAGSRKNNLRGGGASNLGSGGGVEDYNEIFGASRVSSIPTLDLSALEETNVSDHVWSSKVDYNKVFGGFKEDDIGVSHEQLFAAAAAKRGKSSSNKARNQAETESPLQASSHVNCSGVNQLFSSDASSQMLNCAKQFSMSYHKTAQRSKDGTNGTTHITQLRAIPGFMCFIDETTPLQQPDVDKLKPPLINEVPHTVASTEKTISQDHLRQDVSPFTKEQSFIGVVRSRSGSRGEGSFSDNEFFSAHEIPSKVQTSLCQSVGLDNMKNSSKRSVPSNFGASTSNVSGDCSSPFSDEELDISSNAAASIAALRKALRQAEESIRLAKESMERRSNCLHGFQDQRFKDSLEIKDRGMGRNAHEDNRIEEKNAKETYGRVHPVFQVIDDTNGTKAFRTCETAGDFGDSQKLSTSAKVAGKTLEANVKRVQECDAVPAIIEKRKMEISASDQSDCRIDIMQTIGKYEFQFKEMRIPTEMLAQQECVVGNVIVDEDTCRVKNNMEENLNAVEKVEQGKEQVNEIESVCLVHEDEEEIKGGIAQKCIEKEEKQGGFCEQEISEKKIVALQEETVESKFELPDLKENNDGKCLNQVLELEEAEEKLETTEEEHTGEEIDAHEKDVNETFCNKEEIENNVKVFEDQVGGSDGGIPIISSDCEEIGKSLKETWQKIYNVITMKEACVSESAERTQVNSDKGEETEGGSEDTHEREIDMKSSRNIQDAEGSEERSAKLYGLQGEETFEDIERLSRQIHHSKDNKKIEVTGETIFQIFSGTSSYVGMHDESENKIYGNNMESCQDIASQENGNITKSPKAVLEVNEDKDEAAAAIMAFRTKEFETLNASGSVRSAAENDEIKNQRQDAFEVTHENTENSIDMDSGQQQIENNEEQSEQESSIQNGIEFFIDDYGENVEDVKDSNAIDKEEVVNCNSGMLYEECHWITEGKKSEASQHFNLSNGNETEVDNTMETSQTSTNTESNEENLPKTAAMADNVAEENVEEADREQHRKVGEANRKRREWEKDKIAVERAIREARERAFAEARERAERAAVERANAEVRQRVLTEAREKLEKASAGTKPSVDKVSKQAKLRAERAAVERATAEARERALEKALSQKAASGARTLAGDKFSDASRDDGIKQTFYSSDFDKSDGANIESAQRRRARLERHQRVMERAAKALAEKNKRDLLAQKEQAERNRLAEVLDADIKRWASGKEGNLRALLSTLQYILGPDSGWQPISLTDIITTNAVKKAYRKATLCVHPDKLQQRGATIQQKYTCEKVFDLLKAAWNRFNSEER